jgi:dipeptidyl aminopeptidase/acylaminoacyl peptidase
VRHAPSAAFAAERHLAAPRHTAVPVAPGVAVDSWLVQPPAAERRRPLIVWLQGGGTQYGWQFSHELQLLVAAGHAVLYLNPRGSAGYGTAWMRAVAGPRAAHPGSGWGADDVADITAVVRATLAGHPELDPERVGVMGGSYGGLLTAHLLAQTDLFRAGWAERGPYNLFSDAGTKDEAPWFFEAYLGGSHLDDPASYWQASPLRLVGQITAPLAIVHSEEDRRCSIGQAEELFFALKLLDREVELIRFPGESHELTRSGSPVHRLQRLEILLEWFGRWLSP